MDDLKIWLEAHGLGQYGGVLADNDIDLEVLRHLSDDDLKELGFSLGHRRKLIAALKEEARPERRPRSPGPRPTSDALESDETADRRQLTVLFCDLVGSTELSEKLDPERLRGVLSRYHDAVARAVESYDGHVAKLLGDGVLAFFGWPHAREAQTEMAIRAALAALTAVDAIWVDDARLAARVGIASGPVVVGDMTGGTVHEQGAVAGATPNLAARLQNIAEPGVLVIDDATKRLAGGSFELEDAGRHTLKGFAEPVAVWRVRGEMHKESRFEALHTGPLTEFVGRAHEIGLLADRWREARYGEGQVVLISGEAGLGKSRILVEFTESLDPADCQILRYQCSPHEINAAFQPIISELEATTGCLPHDTAEQRLDKLERHLADLFGDREDAASIFASLMSLPIDRYPAAEMTPQRRKAVTISLLVERMTILGRTKPLAILFEDVHWADPSSLEALDALVDGTQDAPVLMVVTYRPEFSSPWDGFGHVTAHSLNRIGRSDGRAIVERVAAGKRLPDEVLDRILKQTDGIPLFVEELTKTVLEADILEERAGRYVLTGPLPAFAVPATLQDSLMARLDRLAPVKRVVQAAACIGREFDAELLAAALQVNAAELDAALDRLLAAQLIFRRGHAADRRFIFKHALVQDAAYASLLTDARRRLHNRLASTLEKTNDPDPLELARHFSEAGESQRAADLYFAAGRHSLNNSALPEAIGALELGLGATMALSPSPERDRKELDLRVALGAARMANFGWAHPSVADALEPAFPLAKSFSDGDSLGSILWGLWVHYQTRTNFPRAHEWLAELETAAADDRSSDLPIVYDMSAGCQFFWEADYARAIGHTDRLKAAYDPNRHVKLVALTNHDPLVFAQHWAGSLAAWIRGYPEESIERMDESLSLARKIGHPFNLVFALTAGATGLIYLDKPDRLLALCDEAQDVVESEALGPFSERVNVMQWRGGALVQSGDFETGYATAKAGNDFWNESGGRVCNAMFRSWIVLGLGGLGRIDEALELNALNIAHCRESGDRFMEPECVRLEGELRLDGNPLDFDNVDRLFREAMSIAQTHGAKSWELRAATSRARLLVTRDAAAEAANFLEPVLNWFAEGVETHDLRQARTLLDSIG